MSKQHTASYERVFKGFEELATAKPKKRSLPKKIVQAGVATVAGVLICTGFGLMVIAKSAPQEEPFVER